LGSPLCGVYVLSILCFGDLRVYVLAIPDPDHLVQRNWGGFHHRAFGRESGGSVVDGRCFSQASVERTFQIVV
jgi:hypothetical protein